MKKFEIICEIKEILGLTPINTIEDLNYVKSLRRMNKKELLDEYISRYVSRYGDYPSID